MRNVDLSSCFLALFVLLILKRVAAETEALSSSSSPAVLFVFGDSTVDAGNNNYIDTVPDYQANFEPYGQNGFFDHPTGRFSDGRVIVDFIAEYAKLPLLPPYLQPNADYSGGANFASGGGGVLSTTHEGLVIDLGTQLRHFEELESSLIKKLGPENVTKIISKAVYFISMGSNDYIGGYFGNPKMQELHGPEEYVGLVIGNLTEAIQKLYEKGARKFGFLNLSPLGCLPVLRALHPKGPDHGGCFEEASALALAHNNALNVVLSSLEQILNGFKYCNSNFYDWLSHRIHNPTLHGYKEGVNACCGSGPYRGIPSCGGRRKVSAEYAQCDNAEDYIWFDSFHPIERIHRDYAKTLWDGPPSTVGPYRLKDLFFPDNKLTIADVVDYPENDQVITA
nr:GDSL esterase/lipase 1-like [Ipomoea batatas]